MNIGDIITITPAELVAGGAALAKIDGFPIFAVNVFPGDTAQVRITEVKKGFARAELVRVVSPSSLRRAAPCPIAEECGGCDWTALRLDAQLAAKVRILSESLRRIGKISPESLPPIRVHPSPLNYRLRSRLHRDGDAVGFYAMNSHRVVQLVPECEVVGQETALQVGSGGGGQAPSPVQSSAPDLEIWEVNGELMTEGDLHIEGYVIPAGGFFQVNRHLLQTMLRLVKELAIGRTAIDLYSGAGFFSVPIAQVCERVIAVEGARTSHDYAKRNVPGNVKLVNAPVETWIHHMPSADFVFLDPPRSGAKRNVIEAVAKKTKQRICFLACDPVTFARDANLLLASGWRLSTLDLLDLFPNTHHVETLSSFERAG